MGMDAWSPLPHENKPPKKASRCEKSVDACHLMVKTVAKGSESYLPDALIPCGLMIDKGQGGGTALGVSSHMRAASGGAFARRFH